MHITKKFLAALVVAVAIISAVVGGGMALLFGGSATPTASAPVTVTVTAAPATATPPANQPKVMKAVDNGPAAELVPDSKGDTWDASYRCKEGFVPVQVAVGKTTQKDGATLSLTEERHRDYGYATYNTDQISVTLHVKLDNYVYAPTLIINTGAHGAQPYLYPQHLFQASLQPGGANDYNFFTLAYTPAHYEDDGITDVTVCTHSTN